jgi:hypothetical protein
VVEVTIEIFAGNEGSVVLKWISPNNDWLDNWLDTVEELSAYAEVTILNNATTVIIPIIIDFVGIIDPHTPVHTNLHNKQHYYQEIRRGLLYRDRADDRDKFVPVWQI